MTMANCPSYVHTSVIIIITLISSLATAHKNHLIVLLLIFIVQHLVSCPDELGN